MITSKDCYLRGRCKKFLDGNCPSEVDEFCIKLFKLNYLYEESLLSTKQRMHTELRVDRDGTDKKAFQYLKSLSDSIEGFVKKGDNIYIHSSQCGNGKTEWAIRMIQCYFEAIWHKCSLSCKALFINVPRFLLALKDNISEKSDYVEHIKKNILTADIVVWDELGTKDATTFEHEHLLNLINTRIDYNKSNIYTSNLTPDELKDRLGERLYSRIVNLSHDMEFFGKDKRGLRVDSVTVPKQNP